MRLIGLIFGWYLLFGAGFALPLAAAGYDCNRASTPSEIAICADSDLSATDAVINYIWKGHTHSDTVRLGQRQWLVFTKWVGHGDQSHDVIYRLHDGELVPARAKLDNCSDQQAKYIAVYFRDF